MRLASKYMKCGNSMRKSTHKMKSAPIMAAVSLALSLVLIWNNDLSAQSDPATEAEIAQKKKEREEEEDVGTEQASTMVGMEAFREVIETGEYLVGPGDGFTIMIGLELPVFAEVTAEGGLFIPTVGRVGVGGKTLREARQLVADAYDEKYKEGDIAVELSQIRQFPVKVVGSVENPGLYVTSGVVRVSELIRQAEVDESSRRNIRLVKTGDLNTARWKVLKRFIATGDLGNIESWSQRVDLDMYEVTGASEYNPFVVDGDLILVPREAGNITISGAVQRPGVYEFARGDRISDLLMLGLGTATYFDPDRVELFRYRDDKRTMDSQRVDIRGVLRGEDDLLLQEGDRLAVRSLREYLKSSTVTLLGEVTYPGFYVVEKDLTKLRDVLEASGGFTEDAAVEEARIFRLLDVGEEQDPEFERIRTIPVADRTEDDNQYFIMKSREIRGQMVVDFVALNEGDESQNILLLPGDRIEVPPQLRTVKVSGQAAFPGVVIYNEAYGVEDYIERAGGRSWRASGDIRVIKARTGETKRARDVKQVEPGDRIWIKEKPRRDYWSIFTQAVTVVGNVATVIVLVVTVQR